MSEGCIRIVGTFYFGMSVECLASKVVSNGSGSQRTETRTPAASEPYIPRDPSDVKILLILLHAM